MPHYVNNFLLSSYGSSFGGGKMGVRVGNRKKLPLRADSDIIDMHSIFLFGIGKREEVQCRAFI